MKICSFLEQICGKPTCALVHITAKGATALSDFSSSTSQEKGSEWPLMWTSLGLKIGF